MGNVRKWRHEFDISEICIIAIEEFEMAVYAYRSLRSRIRNELDLSLAPFFCVRDSGHVADVSVMIRHGTDSKRRSFTIYALVDNCQILDGIT